MGRPRTADRGLPARVHIKGKSYYHCGTVNGKRVWTPLGRDQAYAFLAAEQLDSGKRGGLPMSYAEVVEHARTIFNRCKGSAKRRAIECTITKKEIEEMLSESGGACSISGKRFDFAPMAGSHWRPWVPSLDRINPKVGYTKENCRIVCFAVNLAMNNWGMDVLNELVSTIMRKNRTVGTLRMLQKSPL